MNVSLARVILYVQDVVRLAVFYRDNFGLAIIEEIAGEWVVLAAGACELALHRAGAPYRVADPRAFAVQANVKLVLAIDGDLTSLRAELIGKGVSLGEIKTYSAVNGRLCDGRDPEGNVFQLWQAAGV